MVKKTKIFGLNYLEDERCGMKSIEEAIEFIESLPKEDFYKLRDWILERDWERWDEEIEEDSKSGKLDFLIKQVLDEKKQGFLEDL